MNEPTINTPQIGKDVIESLTLGMYNDCKFIYREYIQNAADAIDKAVQQGIITKEEACIFVNIDSQNRTITVEDNGTGIAAEKVMPILRNIAHSTKRRGEDKGFRGIGRLGGLGYCSKLTFETSLQGEPIKSIMTWDASLLKNIINNRDTSEEATAVLSTVTHVNTKAEDCESHYFKVTMEDVTTEELLDSKSVTEYLSMVAPVDLPTAFVYRSKIREFMKKNNLTVDTYNIFVNDERIYKPYTTSIYESSNGGGKKKVDDIIDVKFLLSKDDNNNLIYWGWYTISMLKGQIKQVNIARGIRLRKENIQIGDEEICKKFFTKTDDQRFSFYYFGEIHAISNGLIPNSRRDYFGESDECAVFEQKLREDFVKLKNLCYDALKLRTQYTAINKTEELRATLAKKEEKGFTSTEEREELLQSLMECEKKEEKAKKDVAKLRTNFESAESPLSQINNHYKQQSSNTTQHYVINKCATNHSTLDSNTERTKFRTDNTIYSQYSKKEKKLIGKIYEAIEKAIADIDLREAVIHKIEEQLTK